MHMSDALISPVVGGVGWAVAGTLTAYAARRVQREPGSNRPAVMGVGGAFVFVERFGFAVAAGFVPVATTGVDAVARALGRLGMPRVFVTQLLLPYRHGFLPGAEASRMLRAHALRVPSRPRPTLRTMRSWLGELLVSSLARAERVHSAMLCRGFDGALRARGPWQFGVRDAVFLGLSLGFLALVRLGHVPYWLASLLP